MPLIVNIDDWLSNSHSVEAASAVQGKLKDAYPSTTAAF
jgi:hypothetical protein